MAAFVNFGNNGADAPSTTIAASAINATGGNLIVGAVKYEGASSTTVTVADTAGNTYTVLTGRKHSTANLWVYPFYARNITGNASNVVTATFGASQQYRGIAVAQYSGLDTGAGVLLFDDVAETSGSQTVLTSPSETFPSTGVMVGFVAPFATRSFTTPYNERYDAAIYYPGIVDRIISAGGSYTIEATLNAVGQALLISLCLTDPAVPNAPSGVTAGSITASSATCSWTDNSSDETGFKVQYAPSPYSSWTNLSGSPAAANATSLATGAGVLTDGTAYKFRVASTNANGDSAWVESGVFTTLSLTRLRPSADTTVGTATSTGANLYGVLDEAVADDADYITIPGTLTSISLVQGHPSETNIKTWTPSPGGSFATSTLTMTSGEASSITDYSALYVKIVTSSTTTKLKFENATDPANDNDHALAIRLRQA